MEAGGEEVSSAASYESEIPFTSSNPTFRTENQLCSLLYPALTKHLHYK